MPEFIDGLRLSGHFCEVIVKPVLVFEFADLVHFAALIDYGSEVLGYDTPLSTDYEWGPRLVLFVTEDDYESRMVRGMSNPREGLKVLRFLFRSHLVCSSLLHLRSSAYIHSLPS